MPELLKQIRPGIISWAATTSYPTLGVRRSRSGNAYELIGTGTSGTTGPSGTGSSILDGTCRWKWSSAVDYTSVQAWYDALPSTVTQAHVAEVWDDGPILGVNFLNANRAISGLSSTNYLTVRPAAGEGFADKLGGASGLPLAFPSAGVRFIANNAENWAFYCDISSNWITIEGIAFRDQYAGSTSSIVYNRAANSRFTLRRCLFDGYPGQGFWLFVSEVGTTSWLIDNLFIDRRPTPGVPFVWPVDFYGPGVAVGNTIVAVDGNADEGIINNVASTVGAVLARNNLVAGYSLAAFIEGGSAAVDGISADHNVTTAPTIGANVDDNGGNVTGASLSGLFVSATADFRLKAGSAALGAATTDATYQADGLDILKTTRVSPRDAGAAEGMLWATAAVGLGTVAASSAAGQSVAATGKATVGPVAAVAAAKTQQYDMAGKASLGPVAASAVITGHQLTAAVISLGTVAATATMQQVVSASGTGKIGSVAAIAQTVLSQDASAIATVGTVTAAGVLSQTPEEIDGTATIGAVKASGLILNPRPIMGTATAGPVALVSTAEQRDMTSATVTVGPLTVSAGLIQATYSQDVRATAGPVTATGTAHIAEQSSGAPVIGAVAAIGQIDLIMIGDQPGINVGPVTLLATAEQENHIRALADLGPVTVDTTGTADNGMSAVVTLGPVTTASRFARRVAPPESLQTLVLPWEDS